jgi:hypothetical protein
MKRLRLAIALAIALIPAAAGAQFTGPVPVTQATIALPTSTQARTTLITGVAGQRIYVVGFHLVPGTSSVVTWSAGTTGTNCASGTVVLEGPDTYPATAAPDRYGVGEGAVLIAGPGLDVCLTVSGAGVGGSVAYAQF